MTNEQINDAIAEVDGWKLRATMAELCGWRLQGSPEHQKATDGWQFGHTFAIDPSGKLVSRNAIPNYCTDLNAMHEAEETLTEEQWDFMFGYLVSIRWRNASEDERRGLGSQKQLSPARATARQRAEAFLKTLGKWEEGE
jgi:hypothetical protein